MGERAVFNTSELRMLDEILRSAVRGTRLISTQIAKKIGLTRSAVSQMVNRLEERGVVKRVPDAVDRKIAYIELSNKAIEQLKKQKESYCLFVEDVIQEFGEENLEKLFSMLERFGETVSNLRKCKD